MGRLQVVQYGHPPCSDRPARCTTATMLICNYRPSRMRTGCGFGPNWAPRGMPELHRWLARALRGVRLVAPRAAASTESGARRHPRGRGGALAAWRSHSTRQRRTNVRLLHVIVLLWRTNAVSPVVDLRGQ